MAVDERCFGASAGGRRGFAAFFRDGRETISLIQPYLIIRKNYKQYHCENEKKKKLTKILKWFHCAKSQILIRIALIAHRGAALEGRKGSVEERRTAWRGWRMRNLTEPDWFVFRDGALRAEGCEGKCQLTLIVFENHYLYCLELDIQRTNERWYDSNYWIAWTEVQQVTNSTCLCLLVSILHIYETEGDPWLDC